jgi:hypothetical protein
MYVKRNTEARPCNHSFSGKALRQSVALYSQHAMRMRHIVICGLPGPTVFFHIIS